jgi:hypothetical protein
MANYKPKDMFFFGLLQMYHSNHSTSEDLGAKLPGTRSGGQLAQRYQAREKAIPTSTTFHISLIVWETQCHEATMTDYGWGW